MPGLRSVDTPFARRTLNRKARKEPLGDREEGLAHEGLLGVLGGFLSDLCGSRLSNPANA
jgi:hypothetical protein